MRAVSAGAAPLYFDGATDICNACRLHETFAHVSCSSCSKPRALSNMRERKHGQGVFVCYSCAPEEWPYECTACHVFKEASAFPRTAE